MTIESILPIIIVLALVLIITIIALIIYLNKGESQFGKKKIPAIDKHILLDIFDIYKKVQYAWSEFDIVPLKEYLSPEIYQYYLIQLNKLKQANQKNIISDIELIETKKIYFRPLGEDQEKIIVSIKAELYNYVIDSQTKEVIRGTKDNKITNNYKITLTRKKSINSTVVCPNCGKTTEFNDKGECKYCNAFILGKEYHFIIQQIDNI